MSIRVNPYKLFSLPEPKDGTFTREELKSKMRKLVLITHPDKSTGSEKKFRVVMECFKFLSKVLREREKTSRKITDKFVDETRILRESEKVEIPATNSVRFTKGSGKKFDLESFNAFFVENRLDNPMDRGHGDWLKEMSKKENTTAKVSESNFGDIFEEQRRKIIKETRLTSHTGIQAANGPSMGTSIDQDSGGYSGTIKTGFGLTGSDIREAHEHGIIAVDDDKYSGHFGRVDLDAAKRERSSANLVMTEDEKRIMENQEQKTKREEQERIQRIIKQQERERLHFEKINGLITDV